MKECIRSFPSTIQCIVSNTKLECKIKQNNISNIDKMSKALAVYVLYGNALSGTAYGRI
jgi:hypothetical protein